MKKTFKYIVFIMLCTYLTSCVESFDVDIYTSKGYLLIDGTITDLVEQQYVSIARTDPDVKYASSDFTSEINPPRKSSIPLTGAVVRLLVNGSQNITLSELEPGNYVLPNSFRGKVGDVYKLTIFTKEGTNYESSDEKMLPVAPIKKVSEEFNSKGVKRLSFYGDYTPTNDLSIDFDDPVNEKNFYRWRWYDYETIKFCETCARGRYYQYETDKGLTGSCLRDLTLKPNELYDYQCQDLCWDIFPSTDIIIFSDVYTNGQPQTNKLVAQVPLYQTNACLVNIQQMSISANAYRYYKLVQDQSVSTGTLADTPPAPIRSNVYNVNNRTELVLGYFTASAVYQAPTMVYRKNTVGGQFDSIFRFLNNRGPQGELVSFERGKAPDALCIPSRTRTPNYPYGWK
jgi:Domain of unknown function (DUF4249)